MRDLFKVFCFWYNTVFLGDTIEFVQFILFKNAAVQLKGQNYLKIIF